VSPGPPNESSQSVAFQVSNNNPGLFSAQPAISPDGTLTYTPAGGYGKASVTVRLTDNGGTANGGSDTSPPFTFTISVVPTLFIMGDQDFPGENDVVRMVRSGNVANIFVNNSTSTPDFTQDINLPQAIDFSGL